MQQGMQGSQFSLHKPGHRLLDHFPQSILECRLVYNLPDVLVIKQFSFYKLSQTLGQFSLSLGKQPLPCPTQDAYRLPGMKEHTDGQIIGYPTNKCTDHWRDEEFDIFNIHHIRFLCKGKEEKPVQCASS
jgi:hypothetical protein